MKRYALIILLISLITGCGSKNKLICEKKEKYAGYDYLEEYELIYDKKGEELQLINLSIESDYNEFYTDSEIHLEYDEVLEYCEFYEAGSDKKILCDASLDNHSILIDIKIKVNEIDDSIFEKMMYVTKSEISHVDDTKEMLENVGYSCK